MASILKGPPKPPAIKPPPEMPDADAIARQKEKEASMRASKSGRSSTILTDDKKVGL